MDTEKLNTAANDYSKSLYESGMYDKETPTTPEDMAYAFKGGVKWLQSQPLTERLTDEEIKNFKSMFKQMRKDFDRTPAAHNLGLTNAMEWMDDIFGLDFLKNCMNF